MTQHNLGKIILNVGDWAPQAWIEHLEQHVPRDDVILYDGAKVPPPEICEAVNYAVSWRTPDGFFGNFPNLKAILSAGAGVDHLVQRTDMPETTTIIRVIDPDLTGRVTAWAVMNVIAHHRQALAYLEAQRQRKWAPLPQSSATDVRVGILGLGEIGRSCGDVLKQLGYDVAGWARRARPDASVPVFAGWESLDTFLARTDILLCLLPLTDETRGILNRSLFEKLARDGVIGGPVLINGGRGGHQVEAELLEALQDGTLKGASIDVFHQEPMPSDDPLWTAPNILITPHTAGMSAPEALLGRMVQNLLAFANGEAVDAIVDRKAGY
ncbi:MAG: glyoxylate/hydroxypyruvate reductase A [Pseudomonadota bacterium]